MRRWVVVAEEALRQVAQPVDPDDLVLQERRREHGSGENASFDPAPVPPLRRLPAREVAVGDGLGQQPVADDGVGDVAVEVEIGEAALRLLDDHLLRVDDQPHRRDLAIGEEVVQLRQAACQLLRRVEDAFSPAPASP